MTRLILCQSLRWASLLASVLLIGSQLSCTVQGSRIGGNSTYSSAEDASSSWQKCHLFLAPSTLPHGGWGVYASRSFEKDEIVDIAPLFVPFESNLPIVKNTVLDDYIYGYTRGNLQQAHQLTVVAFGTSMFYNHHTKPNVEWKDFGQEPSSDQSSSAPAGSARMVGFTARRYVEMGEELFSTYGAHDGGKTWFQDRRLEMTTPTAANSSKLATLDLQIFQKKYCSHIYAGIGLPTWKDRVVPGLGPNYPYRWDESRLAAIDAGPGDAMSKSDLRAGDRIEISPALVLSSAICAGTALSPLVLTWDSLHVEHRDSLRELRKQGRLELQFQGPVTQWHRKDHFESFASTVLLPVAGSIGLVERVGPHNKNANCRLEIHSSANQTESHATRAGSAGIVLELIATRDISVGEVLKLNIARTGSLTEGLLLYHELELTGQPMAGKQLLGEAAGKDEL